MRRANNLKIQRRMVIVALLLACVLLVGGIYLRINPKKIAEDTVVKDDAAIQAVEVAEIEEDENYKEKENTNVVEVPKVELEPTDNIVDDKAEKVVISVPMPVKPSKPEKTPPQHVPQTDSDLGNPDKKPVYAEEEVVYVPEVVEEVEKDKEREEVDETTENQQDANIGEGGLVPDSENPFLQGNIPTNASGLGGGVKAEDISDHVSGTGDKF